MFLMRKSVGRARRVRAGQGRAGQGRAGQGRAGQGRAGQGRAGQGRAGHGRAGQGRAGQGRAGQGRAGQGRAGQGKAGQGRAGQGRAGQGRGQGQPQSALRLYFRWVERTTCGFGKDTTGPAHSSLRTRMGPKGPILAQQDEAKAKRIREAADAYELLVCPRHGVCSGCAC